MPSSHVWSAIAGVAAAVAAIAALLAILYVRRTILVARETLATAKETLDEAHEARRGEQAAQREALADERHVLRLRSLEQISEAVSRIGIHLRELAPKGAVAMHVRTEQHRLRTSLAVFTLVGGPELPRCKALSEAPQHMVGFLLEDAFDELVEATPGVLE